MLVRDKYSSLWDPFMWVTQKMKCCEYAPWSLFVCVFIFRIPTSFRCSFSPGVERSDFVVSQYESCSPDYNATSQKQVFKQTVQFGWPWNDHFGVKSFCQLTLDQLDMSSTGLVINLTFHQLDISSTWHFINLTFHQLDISSTWHFFKLTFHQLDARSTCG